MAAAIAKYLQFDTHLVHVDLSHTQLSAEGGEVIGKALGMNSTLVGIHTAGAYTCMRCTAGVDLDGAGALGAQATRSSSMPKASCALEHRSVCPSWRTRRS